MKVLASSEKGTCGYIQPRQNELVLGEKFTHSLRLHPFAAGQLGVVIELHV